MLPLSPTSIGRPEASRAASLFSQTASPLALSPALYFSYDAVLLRRFQLRDHLEQEKKERARLAEQQARLLKERARSDKAARRAARERFKVEQQQRIEARRLRRLGLAPCPLPRHPRRPQWLTLMPMVCCIRLPPPAASSPATPPPPPPRALSAADLDDFLLFLSTRTPERRKELLTHSRKEFRLFLATQYSRGQPPPMPQPLLKQEPLRPPPKFDDDDDDDDYKSFLSEEDESDVSSTAVEVDEDE